MFNSIFFKNFFIFFFSISVISEFLLYFIFGESLFSKLSRIFQITFLIFFLLKTLINPISISKNLVLNGTTTMFAIFIIFSLFITIINFFLGTYYNGLINYLIFQELINVKESSISNSWNSVLLIPIKETLKYIYFFFYFVILLPLIINTKEKFIYFIKLFIFIYVLSLFIGFYVLINTYDNYGQVLLSRHWYYNDQMNLGFRYHGIFGEPRDASVALVIGIMMVYVKSIYTQDKPSYLLIFLSIVALLCTMSGSLMISLLLFPLLFLYINPKILLNIDTKFIFLFLLIGLAFIIILYSSERTLIYFNALFTFFTDFKNNESLSSILAAQSVNVFPIYEFLSKIFTINFYYSIIGHGTGSSNILKIPFESFSLAGAHSLLARILYEYGLIGILIWISIFTKSIYSLKKYIKNNEWQILMFIYIFLISISLIHKSHLIYIAMGVFIIMRNLYNESLDSENISSEPKFLA